MRVKCRKFARILSQIFEMDQYLADNPDGIKYPLIDYRCSADRVAIKSNGECNKLVVSISPDRIVPNGFQNNQKSIVETIRSARKTINIQNLELLPDPKFSSVKCML